jgi:hypothetical protein
MGARSSSGRAGDAEGPRATCRHAAAHGRAPTSRCRAAGRPGSRRKATGPARRGLCAVARQRSACSHSRGATSALQRARGVPGTWDAADARDRHLQAVGAQPHDGLAQVVHRARCCEVAAAGQAQDFGSQRRVTADALGQRRHGQVWLTQQAMSCGTTLGDRGSRSAGSGGAPAPGRRRPAPGVRRAATRAAAALHRAASTATAARAAAGRRGSEGWGGCRGRRRGYADRLGRLLRAHPRAQWRGQPVAGPPPNRREIQPMRPDQRWPIGLTSRRVEPTNNWRGRPILYSGSPIISLSCAIQPTVRASAKMAVNRLTGMPMARCTMPE